MKQLFAVLLCFSCCLLAAKEAANQNIVGAGLTLTGLGVTIIRMGLEPEEGDINL